MALILRYRLTSNRSMSRVCAPGFRQPPSQCTARLGTHQDTTMKQRDPNEMPGSTGFNRTPESLKNDKRARERPSLPSLLVNDIEPLLSV